MFGEVWLEYTRNLRGEIHVWNKQGHLLASGRPRPRHGPFLDRLRDTSSLLPIEVVDPPGHLLLELTRGANDRLCVERDGAIVGEISWAKRHIFALYAGGACVALVRPVHEVRWWKPFPGDFSLEGPERTNLGAVTRPGTGRSPVRSWAFVLELRGAMEEPLRTLVPAVPLVMSRALQVEIAKSAV